MWPFSKKPEVHSGVLELIQRVAVLETRLAALEGQHVALRGYVYARKGRAGDLPDGPTEAPETNANLTPRDRLRQIAGIRAGQPYPHK